MATEVQMPTLGLTMTEGSLEEWFKKDGDHVEKGEAICQIASEKLTHDVEAPASGTLKILVPAGTEEIATQAVIATIE